jgi:hypothetical protein
MGAKIRDETKTDNQNQNLRHAPDRLTQIGINDWDFQ